MNNNKKEADSSLKDSAEKFREVGRVLKESEMRITRIARSVLGLRVKPKEDKP
jgi:hypothetical protein